MALLKKILALNVGEDMEMGSTKWSRKNFANWQSKSEDGVIDDWKKDELIELLSDGNYSEEDEESDNPVYDLGDLEVADEVTPPESKGYGPHGGLDGVTYGDIAKEFGFTKEGAKRATVAAMEKFKFMLGLSDAERLEIVLPAMSDYIDELAATGEIDQEDIQFLKQHPKDVAQSDGFRDHMKKYVNRAMRKSGKEIEVEDE